RGRGSSRARGRLRDAAGRRDQDSEESCDGGGFSHCRRPVGSALKAEVPTRCALSSDPKNTIEITPIIPLDDRVAVAARIGASSGVPLSGVSRQQIEFVFIGWKNGGAATAIIWKLRMTPRSSP